MYPNKFFRLFFASILLISTSFSSFIISPAQASINPTVTLSPAVTAKLDAFIVKVQVLQSKYSSDTDWNTFLDKLGMKINTLKSQYTGNVLILAVLDRLSSGISGLKVQVNTISSSVPIILSQSIPGTIDNAGNYHFATSTHQETPFPELAKGPKSFAPMMNCEIKDFSTLELIKNDTFNKSGMPETEWQAVKSRVFKLWDDNIAAGQPVLAQYVGHNSRWIIPQHGCIAVKFTTGSGEANLILNMASDPIAQTRPSLFNISRNPGDFDYTNVDNKVDGNPSNNCGSSAGVNSGRIDANIGDYDDANIGDYCRLQHNTTYYINIRNEDLFTDYRHPNKRGVDSCTDQFAGSVGGCGGVFQLQYHVPSEFSSQ